MDCSTPSFHVHYQLPEHTQIHVHHVSDAIKASHPLSPPFPPAFNLSQHQGLSQESQFFASAGQSIGVSASASVFPINIQDWFSWGLTDFISQNLHKLMSIKSVMLSSLLILCHLLLLLPSIFPSIRVFSNESALLIRWPKYCSFHFSISLSNEYSGLISFRID